MKNFLYTFFFLIILFAALYTTTKGIGSLDFAHAEIKKSPLVESGLSEQITLKATPTYPQPGQEVTARIEAYGVDLDNSSVAWYTNNTLASSGTGQKTFKTTMGGMGTTLTIKVRVVTLTGTPPIERTLTLSTQDVDIIQEAKTNTSPFYKGASLYTAEADVRLVAMPNLISPNGVKIDPKTLVYTWKIDNRVLGSKSGYGQNVLDFTGSILQKRSYVEVLVSAPDGTQGYGNSLLIPQQTETFLYERNPLYGVLFNKALAGSFSMKESEINIGAYPYFFSTVGNPPANISYVWKINNNLIGAPKDKNYAVFRNTLNQKGSSLVSVSLANTVKIFQQSGSAVSIEFQEK